MVHRTTRNSTRTKSCKIKTDSFAIATGERKSHGAMRRAVGANQRWAIGNTTMGTNHVTSRNKQRLAPGANLCDVLRKSMRSRWKQNGLDKNETTCLGEMLAFDEIMQNVWWKQIFVETHDWWKCCSGTKCLEILSRCEVIGWRIGWG